MLTTNSLDRSKRRLGKLVRDDCGLATIELALVTPIFVILLLGAADFGRLMYIWIDVTNAARAGVQYGAQSRATAENNAAMQTAATNDGSTDVTGLTATATQFCSCANGSSSTCLPTDCSGSHIIEYVQVNTSVSVAPMFTYPGLPGTLTLTGQAVMRVEQ